MDTFVEQIVTIKKTTKTIIAHFSTLVARVLKVRVVDFLIY